MLNKSSKVALVLGHPGHELRIFNFIEVYKPRIYILTDGSGSENSSRVARTLKLAEDTGCPLGNVIGPFSDKEIYQIIKDNNFEKIRETMDLIIADWVANDITVVAGDGLEGFNPTHDLCRYMVNAMVEKYARITKGKVYNYAFALDGPPDSCPTGVTLEPSWLHLDDAAFERKYNAAKNYPEIAKDMDALIAHYGEKPFRIECLWPIENAEAYTNWTTEEPYYETYGKKKVSAGVYDDVITFNYHLLPLAIQLTKYATS